MPDQQPNQPLWRFMFWGRPQDEELAYRRHYLKDDIRQIATITYAAIGFMFALTLQDLPGLRTNPELMSGILTRFVLMAVGVVSVYTMKSEGPPLGVDLRVLGFTSIVAIGVISIHLLPSISAARIVAIGTGFIMAVHIGFPSYAATLLLPVMILMIGETVIIFSPGRDSLKEYRVFIPLVFVFAEYIAVMASAYHHRTRYKAFRSLQKEQLLNQQLQSATGRINVLHGLLPICANCKRIRDDQGYYQQIEHYITEHSEAEFTHGICPDCAKELYPHIKYPDS
ncbi:MAG: hypothetical protein IID13_02015 [Candidatus Marinimicrobia bacterium]|nr:hypothetical protein [Candidatus Neomarinimicrobiota bacterium]